MNQQHLRGVAYKARGAVMDAVGKFTGDRRLQLEGKFEKARGSAHSLAGDALDAVRNAAQGLQRTH